MGFLFVILFSLNDFIGTALDLTRIRLSDYSHLAPAILFSLIQVQRFGRLYKSIDGMVQKRTEELKQANEDLRLKVIEYRQIESEMRRQAQTMTALYETTRDLVVELVQANAVPFEEREIPEPTLRTASEEWVTSSTRELMPVVQLDGVAVGDGKAGPVWQLVQALYGEDKRALSADAPT